MKKPVGYHLEVPLETLLDRELLIISGKGGVGKTTVAAALGVLAARRGLRVLVAEVEGKGALTRLLNGPELTNEAQELRPGLFAMNISPEEALREYFEIQFGLKRIARSLVSTQLVYYVTHAAPGLRDILMLGKVWYTATREKSYDLIVLDTPAAGHAVSMLRSPEGFLRAVSVGPLANHTRQVVEFLKDSSKVSIHLVTLAEEMPVNETVETTRMLEQTLKMDVSGIFVNMLYSAPAEDPKIQEEFEALSGPDELVTRAKAAGAKLEPDSAEQMFGLVEFYRGRRGLQQTHRKVLDQELSHTAPLIDIPFLFRDVFAEKELDLIADTIEEQAGL